MTALLECPKPSPRPQSPIYSTARVRNEDPCSDVFVTDVAWLFGRILGRSHKQQNQLVQKDDTLSTEVLVAESEGKTHIPTWSAYHSLISDKLPVTRVGSPPLIAAPAHEWQTLLTVLMQAQGISAKVVGADRKTVISLDMGLYKPAKQLQMHRNDMDHLILRPGELHIVMAQLRCIGSYIENSGIDFCWTEADLYGPMTVKQILDGKHVRRGIEAHMTTLQSLFMLYQDAFSQEHPNLHAKLTAAAEDLDQSFKSDCFEEVKGAHSTLMDTIVSEKLMDEMAQFDSRNESRPLPFVIRQYMNMVMEMMLFIRAVRTGDWELHLLALETFTKHFFAHDKLVYARMIPLYIADMETIKTDSGIYQEFVSGNWVVNKNGEIPFCAIGADHALEHLNRAMKVAGGLVGITLNAKARTKFFVIAPELARLAAEARQIAAVSHTQQLHHHALSPTVLARHESNIEALTASIESFTNPFKEETQSCSTW